MDQEEVDFPTKLVHYYHQMRNAGWYGAFMAWLWDVLLKMSALLLVLLAFWWLLQQSWLVFAGLCAGFYISLRILTEHTKRRRRKQIGQDETTTTRIRDMLTKILTRFDHKVDLPSRLLELHYDVNESPPFLILSDLHRGAGNPADDFQKCYFVYKKRLQQLCESQDGKNDKMKLILLGDVEELWEEEFDDIAHVYPDLYTLESQLVAAGRCYRVWGNHDIDFRYPLSKATYALQQIYTDNGVTIQENAAAHVYEAIKINVLDGEETLGILYLIHGHQGTDDSDTWLFISRWAVRWLWRWLQNLLWISRNTPAQSVKLGDAHDNAMRDWAYDWNANQRHHNNSGLPVILITGHTHHLLALKHDKAQPQLYFNTGCCAFSDGMITGIEIVHGEIQLKRWKANRLIDPNGIALDRAIAKSPNHRFRLKELFAQICELPK